MHTSIEITVFLFDGVPRRPHRRRRRHNRRRVDCIREFTDVHKTDKQIVCTFKYKTCLQQSNKPGEDEQGESNSLPEESCANNDNKSEISSSSKKNYVSPVIYYMDLDKMNSLQILHFQTLNKPNVKNVEYGDEQDETTSRPEESCENDDNKTEITSSSANNYVSLTVYIMDLDIINILHILHFAAI